MGSYPEISAVISHMKKDFIKIQQLRYKTIDFQSPNAPRIFGNTLEKKSKFSGLSKTLKFSFNSSVKSNVKKSFKAKSIHLILMTALVASLSNTSAVPVCDQTVSEARPLSEVRAEGSFSVVSALACENAEPEFFLQDQSTMNSLLESTTEFCWTADLPAEDACIDGEYYNFKRYPELMGDFIAAAEPNLASIPLPTRAMEIIAGTELTENGYRAMMYLCTVEALKEFSEILLSGDLNNIQEKLTALNRIKSLGLFPQFANSYHFTEIILGNSLPNDVKAELIREAFSLSPVPNGLRDVVQGYNNLARKSDRNEAEDALFSFLGQSFTEYVARPALEQNQLQLSFLASNDIPGARAAFEQFNSRPMIQAVSPITDRPENREVIPAAVPVVESTLVRQGGRGNFALLENSPRCEEYSQATLEQKQSSRDIMNSFLSDLRSRDPSRVERLRDSTQYIDYFANNFSNDEVWRSFEIFVQGSGDPNYPSILQSARSYFCFNQRVRDNISKLSGSSTNKREIAEAVLTEIMTMRPGFDMLNALESILPHLDDTGVRRVLTLMDNMGAAPNMELDEVVEQVRIGMLLEIQQRYQDAGAPSHPNANKAIEVLAKYGGAQAESELAKIFVRTDSVQLRRHILSQYRHPLLLNQVGSNFSILKALRSVPNNNEYVLLLRGVLGGVSTTDGFEGSGSISRSEAVLGSVKDSLIASVSALAATDLSQDLSEDSRNAQDVTGGVVSSGFSAISPEKRPILAQPIRETEPGRKTTNAINLMQERQQALAQSKIPPALSNADRLTITNKVREAESIEVEDGRSVGGAENEMTNFQDQVQVGQGSGGQGSIQPPRAPSTGDSFVPNNTNNFLSALGGNILPSTFNNPFSGNFAPTPSGTVGEQGTSFTSGSLAGSSNTNYANRSGRIKPEESASSRDTSSGRSSISDEIDKISQATRDIRDELDQLDNTRLPIQPYNPPDIRTASNDESDIESDTIASNPGSRGPASVSEPQNAPAAAPGRGPASVPAGPGGSSRSPGALDNGTGNYTSILSPIDDLSKEDLSKIIKIQSAETKRLLMDYMTEKEKLSCPELRFVQDFYETYIDKFILSKKRKPWREYALVQLDKLTFRFNYPGEKKVRGEIESRCNELKEEISAVGEDETLNREDSEETVDKTLPANEETSIFKSFMLKLGL